TGQTVFSHEPPDAAAESEAGDARFRDDASRDRQAMRMGFAINIAEQRSRLHSHGAQLRVDRNPVHRREVDDNAVIAQRPPGNIVTAAFDCDEKIVSTRKLHGANNIGRVRTTNDQAWMFVNARIPNTSSRIVAGIAGQQRLPTEPASERLDGRSVQGGSSAAFEL